MSPLRGSLSFELSTVTTLVENKKALLVVIAHDVDPTERAVLLPALCRKMGFPTALSRGSQAGVSGPQEDLPTVAFTQVNSEDKGGLAKRWKPSGPMTMTDIRRSTATGEATSQVRSGWLASPPWKKQRLKNWPPNWAEWTLLNFLYLVISGALRNKLKKQNKTKKQRISQSTPQTIG
uniref:60S ribosomal protein L7a n=2 Tax=Canis lupus familiaris TaxID=9615 RepID=A0A8P0TN23_CANLF